VPVVVSTGKEVIEMRTRIIAVVRVMGRWVMRFLEVRLPWGVVAGLRTRR
jgi:hypothetical protein